MTLIEIIIATFIVLESTNILALYFVPGTRKANSVGIFTAWEKSKQQPEIHAFISYLVNWVAGVKLAFIVLLLVILLFADAQVQRYSALAVMATTLTFYWRLFPLIRKMDQRGEVAPKHYSLMLGGMIFAIVALFLVAVFV